MQGDLAHCTRVNSLGHASGCYDLASMLSNPPMLQRRGAPLCPAAAAAAASGAAAATADGSSHGVFFLNSNGMDVLLNKTSVTFK